MIKKSKILKTLFEKHKVDTETIKVPGIRKIFIASLRDYFNEKLELEDLSYIATQLYFEIGNPRWFDNMDLELGRRLYWAGESDYYKRKNKKRYQKIIEDLKNYYESNKEILEG